MLFHRLLMSANGTLPFKPIFVYPDVDGEVLYEFDIIEATAFSDSGGTGAHRNTQWQLSTDENFTSIIYDSLPSKENLTEIEVGDLQTEMLNDYYVRVKYFSFMEPSSWSEPVMFSTSIYEDPVESWSDDILNALSFGF